VLHVPKFKLLVSPVEPAFATQVGAAVDPSVNATFTVTEEPLLKFAREPPALPKYLSLIKTIPWKSSHAVSAAVKKLRAWSICHGSLPATHHLESHPV
jgi:hypothetical protein